METKELDKILEEWQLKNSDRAYFFVCCDREKVHGQVGGKEHIPLAIASIMRHGKFNKVLRRGVRLYEAFDAEDSVTAEKPIPLRGSNANRVKRALEHVDSAILSLRKMQGRDVTEECDERRNECLIELAMAYQVIKKRLTDN